MFNNKGQVSFYIIFLFIATVIILIGAIAAPFGSTLASEFYIAGQGLLNETVYDTIPQISDDGVREALNNSFTSATSAATQNIQISNSIFEYSWLFLLILVGIVMYLIARSLVAYQRIV